MLSASWERAAKPGAPPATGAPHPPAGRPLSSSSELGVCLTIKATTFYSVCTEPKQTTVYRLLFSFLFEMRRFGVLSPATWPVSRPPPDSGSSTPAGGPAAAAPAQLAPTCGGVGTRPGASVHQGHAGAVWALRGPAVHVALFNTVN